MTLAQAIKEALLKKWNDVEAIGLFGSVARGEDIQWSDLDMICIVKSLTGKEDLYFMYKEVPVWVEVWSKSYIAALGVFSDSCFCQEVHFLSLTT